MLRSVGAAIFGILGDRYGRKYPYIANLVLLIIFEMCTGFVQTFPQFLAVRALFGISMGGMYGNASATALEDAPIESRGLLSGLLQEGYAFAAKVSDDESISALIRTTTNWPSGGGYRYDLVVQNLKTGVSRTLLPSSRLGFSRPVFVGNTVLVSEIFDYKYIITRIADDLSSQSVLEIWDASIIHASTVEIASDLEAR